MNFWSYLSLTLCAPGPKSASASPRGVPQFRAPATCQTPKATAFGNSQFKNPPIAPVVRQRHAPAGAPNIVNRRPRNALAITALADGAAGREWPRLRKIPDKYRALLRRRAIGCATASLLVLTPSVAMADPLNKPWSATVYFGPSTTKYFGAILSSGNFEPTGGMLGLALDGRLLNLGQGISVGGEAQITEYFLGHRNTSFAFGLGFQLNEPFGLGRTRVSVYDGPSYALDPPDSAIAYHGEVYRPTRKKFLNYISLEIAVGLSRRSNWAAVIRAYHRSGAWGLYSTGDDDGMAVGVGLKYLF